VKDKKNSSTQDVLNTLEKKKFLSFVESWITGKKNSLVINGTAEQVDSVKSVFEATRNFQNEISKSDTTLGVLTERLEEKKIAAANFERIFGMKWPL
jgi:hypothetical protein